MNTLLETLERIAPRSRHLGRAQRAAALRAALAFTAARLRARHPLRLVREEIQR